ncbi:MAG: pyridoxal phosphate-dependent aminotransferase [Actinomycetota bacterium]|jgi:aspartate/methionine/tyrosine aminotransferase|nr:pyridoxal phosphate-dependent aminotransferase [Actinomycetota bacterium]
MSSVTTGTRTARISARAAGVTPSATLTIDAKAKALQAAGERVIGFGAGEPDFPTPPHVVEAAVAACRDPRAHKYTPTPGLPELRAAIADKTRRDSGYDVSPQQVIVTNGGKQAVSNAFTVLCDPGDEVLVCAPYWTTYPESVALAGGVPVFVLAGAAQSFRVTVDQLEDATTARTKVLLFVSPSNPTGAVYPKEEIEEIGRWAAERGLWVVADEIYEHLVYGDAVHHSMPVLVPELADRCIVVNGVAKTYAMTGWRVGWMIGPKDAVAAASNVQSHETSNVSNVSQYAALAAVSGDLDAVSAMRRVFDRRRKTMVEMLRAIPGVRCAEPMGAFYAFPDVSELLSREVGGRRPETSEELAEVCIDVAKVAVVPGEAFGAPGYLRLSYAVADDAMVEGVTRLAELFASAR